MFVLPKNTQKHTQQNSNKKQTNKQTYFYWFCLLVFLYISMITILINDLFIEIRCLFEINVNEKCSIQHINRFK